jgi:hypothetical protein
MVLEAMAAPFTEGEYAAISLTSIPSVRNMSAMFGHSGYLTIPRLVTRIRTVSPFCGVHDLHFFSLVSGY